MGFFKRMNGLWMPPSDTLDYAASDTLFDKNPLLWSPQSVVNQVGGGPPGVAANESARILFLGCRECDLNHVGVGINAGYGDSGTVTLVASSNEDFSDGYYVRIESKPVQLAMPELRIGQGVASFQNGLSRPGYGSSRHYIFPTDPGVLGVDEDPTYLKTNWPSANILVAPTDYSSPYDRVTTTYSSIDGVFVQNNNANQIYGQSRVTDVLNNGLLPQTFTQYFVSCGTVSNGLTTEVSKQGLWTSISGTSGALLWLGIVNGYIKTGLDRFVFMPPMSISQTTQDQWNQSEVYWRVDAKCDSVIEVVYATSSVMPGAGYPHLDTINTHQASGLATRHAQGTSYKAIKVTESPKSRSRRASLVTSPQGLIYRQSIIPGINQAHTRKAGVYESAWPFEQPGGHATSLAIGAAKATSGQLKITFESTYPAGGENYYQYNDTPRARVLVYDSGLRGGNAQTGRIQRSGGNSFNPTLFPPLEIRDSPTLPLWEGMFDEDFAIMDQDPIADAANHDFTYGQQTVPFFDSQWRVSYADTYDLEIDSLRQGLKTFWDGTYNATNTMPDGTQSPGDYFHASPDFSADVKYLTPTLEDDSLPTLSLYDGRAYAGDPITSTRGILSYFTNMGILWPATKQVGRFIGGFFGGPVDVDLDFTQVNYRAATSGFFNTAWTVISQTTDKTSTSIHTEVVIEQQKKTTYYGYLDSLPTEPVDDFHKASPERIDSILSRACQAAKIAVIKSCKWTPQKTQLFAFVHRAHIGASGLGLPGGWGYYGGTVPDADVLEMLDQYKQYRGERPPEGGVINTVVRRAWQIEAQVAYASPTYTPCETVSESVATLTFSSGGLSDSSSRVFTGTTRFRFSLDFDLESADVTTHKMNHELVRTADVILTEQQFTDLEEGLPVTKKLNNGLTDATFQLM